MKTVTDGRGSRPFDGLDGLARHALLLAVAEVLSPHLNGSTSYRLAQALQFSRSSVADMDGDDVDWLADGLAQVEDERVTFWANELNRLAGDGVMMLDALDDDYPANLRMVHNRPPFLMVRGNIKSTDVRAMAVVGTRHPSPKGLDNASRISRGLAARGVTVVSGLASGIDSAAHRGAIEGGGRTIAVFGTGIDSVYPAQNAELAAQVANYGACVSQFWPAMRGARWTFPARNLVTSGLSIGTVVVEAGETSGARLQAIAALDHGKRVLLLRRWAESQPWAIEVATRPGVIIVESVDEVIDAVDRELLVDTSAAL